MPVTHGDLLDTTGQDARLASLIRQLATQRPEIAISWTPPPAPSPPPALRRPCPLPFPRVLHPLDPHPVTGRRPTREDFPVLDDLAEFLTRLRPDAAKRRKPHRHYRPVHAANTRPGPLRRAARLLRSLLGGAR